MHQHLIGVHVRSVAIGAVLAGKLSPKHGWSISSIRRMTCRIAKLELSGVALATAFWLLVKPGIGQTFDGVPQMPASSGSYVWYHTKQRS
jgi:hypothetical protein